MGFFGINIGSYSIKVSYIKNISSKMPLIDNVCQVAFPYNTNFSIDNTNYNSDSVTELYKSINLLYKNSKIRTKNCVLSIPERDVYSRLITIPAVQPQELNESIVWGVKSYLPLSVEELNISYVEVGEKKINNVLYKDWYVVAVSKDIIKFYQNLFLDLNLNLLAIETEAIALSRLMHFCLLKLNKNSSIYNKLDCLIVDIGFNTSTIIISIDGVPVFSQSINIGSHALSKSLVNELRMDLNTAESIKKNIDLDEASNPNSENYKFFRSFKPILDIFANEISKILIYYKDKLMGDKIDFIFLTGGGGSLKGLSQYINKVLDIDTTFSFNILNFFTYNKKIDKSYITNLNSFSVPIGLCFKGYV